MMVIYHYIRHHVADSRKCNSLEDAIKAAYWDREENMAYPEFVTDMDGNVLLDNDALHAEVENL